VDKLNLSGQVDDALTTPEESVFSPSCVAEKARLGCRRASPMFYPCMVKIGPSFCKMSSGCMSCAASDGGTMAERVSVVNIS
jgi:hypothetical protein